MIDETGSPLIGDFGKAKEVGDSDLTTSIEGSPAFLPPECCSFDDFE